MILLITKHWSLIMFMALMEAYVGLVVFLHFQYLINFKLKIFDPFRFGNIKIDQISVLKLSLG